MANIERSLATLNLRLGVDGLAALREEVTALVTAGGDSQFHGHDPAEKARGRIKRRLRFLQVDGWATLIDSKNDLDTLALALSQRWSPVLVVRPVKPEPDSSLMSVRRFERGQATQIQELPGDLTADAPSVTPVGLSLEDATTVLRRSFLSSIFTPVAEELSMWTSP